MLTVPFRERVFGANTQVTKADCRSGADRLNNGVGRYGCAVIAVKVSGLPENQVVPRKFSP